MKNMVAILGMLACILSCVVMGSSLMLPMVWSPFSFLFCKAGERLRGEVWTTSNSNRSSVGTTYVCVDSGGNERAVTPQVVSKTTTAFLVLMFGGMGLLAVGGWKAVNSKQKEQEKAKRKNDETTSFDQPQVFQTGDGVTVIAASANVSPAEIASGTTKRLRDMLNENMPPMPTGEKFDLTDALQELEQARTAGLISEDEYQRLRQKVLDKFG